MKPLDWTRIKAKLRRPLTMAPAAACVAALATAAGSAPTPDLAQTMAGQGAVSGEVRLTADSFTDPALAVGTIEGEAAQRANAAMAVTADALRPARPFVFRGSAQDRQRAVRCLTQAVYYEAALEPTSGQQGVAQVVLNRVRDPNYPSTVCGVVFEGAERTTGCQFSFTCDGSLARAPIGWAWDRARVVAEQALSGAVAEQVGTATHYHADYVYPWWSPSLTKITQIGAHIFYRWKGLAGETAAFRQVHSGREPVIDEVRFARPRVLLADADAAPSDAATISQTAGLRTVEIDGRQRVVGVASLGGRRQPTRDEIAAINARLQAFETPAVAEKPAAPPPGVVVMDVEEVGKPATASQEGSSQEG